MSFSWYEAIHVKQYTMIYYRCCGIKFETDIQMNAFIVPFLADDKMEVIWNMGAIEKQPLLSEPDTINRRTNDNISINFANLIII